MILISVAILWASIAASAQSAQELPAAWQQKLEVTFKALKSGDAAQAVALLRDVVSDAEKPGPDDLRSAEPLESLAMFFFFGKQRRLAEAEPLLVRALAIREKRQGPGHRDVANTLLSLGGCRMLIKDKSDPTDLMTLERALAIFETSNGKDDPDVARVLKALAAARMKHEDFNAAETGIRRALLIREKTFGPDSTNVADILDELGTLHTARADRSANVAAGVREAKQAESILKRALKIREKVLKPDDPAIAKSEFNLGQLATALDGPQERVSYFERWLDLKRKANAPESKDQAQPGLLLSDTPSRQP